jgi:RNA polymerase sigma-70 factor, ECF subfamily
VPPNEVPSPKSDSPNRRNTDYEAGSVADELLMVKYQRGDRSAFASLVRRHRVRIYNFVLRHTRNAAVAEELAQEVFLRAVQHAANYKHEARFATWLYAIARNLCIDQGRRQEHRQHQSLDSGRTDVEGSIAEGVGDPHPRASVERSASGGKIREAIVDAVDALPEEQREVFLLREVAGLGFREIAEVTGSSENTVKSRMRYALERLQQALCAYEEYARELK